MNPQYFDKADYDRHYTDESMEQIYDDRQLHEDEKTDLQILKHFFPDESWSKIE